MSMKTSIIDEIIRVEGGKKYTNDPDDSGGATRWGVTEARARASGYMGDMRDMPRAVAFRIFAEDYWDVVRGDDLELLSEAVTFEVVDTGVSTGTGTAGTILQRALNVLNLRGKLYPDLKVDGAIGPVTLAALRGYLAAREEATLLTALNCLQGAYYIELAERREKDERFVYGWLRNRVVIPCKHD